MTVEEIIETTAKLLGVTNEVDAYIKDEATDENIALVEELVQFFNVVENELALDYLPLVAKEEFVPTNGKVDFQKFRYSVVRIIDATKENGEKAAYTLFPKYLKTEAKKLAVTYAYTPAEKGFKDETDYVLGVSKRLFAYGIAAEYALAHGYFEEAAVWDKKYKDAIAATYRTYKNKRMQSRRWV